MNKRRKTPVFRNYHSSCGSRDSNKLEKLRFIYLLAHCHFVGAVGVSKESSTLSTICTRKRRIRLKLLTPHWSWSVLYRSQYFVFKCLNSRNSLVKSIVRHVITVSGSQSPAGKSFCCKHYVSCPYVAKFGLNLPFVALLKLVRERFQFFNDHVWKIRSLIELIFTTAPAV